MKAAVEVYVALRRVAGFALGNTEYLLRSFARFTHDRHEAHIRTASVVEWAGQAPSLAQRHRRYETVRLFAEYARLDEPRHDCPPPRYFAYRKTRRERAMPLWKTTTAALRAWLAVRGAVPSTEVFVNARGQPLSRWGVAHVLNVHGAVARATCASLAGKRLSPHVLRHTCAMIVLQATHDIRKVSLWLGHSHLTTTEMYVRADPTEKLEAIEAIVPPSLRKGTFRPTDSLIAWLKASR